MTVKELIDMLKELDQNKGIAINDTAAGNRTIGYIEDVNILDGHYVIHAVHPNTKIRKKY